MQRELPPFLFRQRAGAPELCRDEAEVPCFGRETGRDSAHTEPAAVADPETERAVEGSRRGIVRYALEVGLGCSATFTFSEQRGTDAAGDSPPSHILADKYCIDPYELTIQDTQSGRRDSSVRVADEYGDLIFWDCVIHAGNYAEVDGVRHFLEGEKSAEPFVIDPVFYLDGQGEIAFRIAAEQRAVHDIDPVLYVVAPGGKSSVKGRIGQRADFENAGCSPPFIDFFTVGNLFLQRQYRCSDRFRTIRPVGVEIRKTEDPAVIDLHLMGRPRVE